MAIYFDALVGTKSQPSAARIAKRLVSNFSLHYEAPAEWTPKYQLYWISIIPRGMGLGVPYDDDQDCEQFGSEQANFAKDFYELIRKEDGVEVALLGWEIADQWFDPTEENKIVAGLTQIPDSMTSMPGLVVSEEIIETLPSRDCFLPFTNRLHWVQIDDWNFFKNPH